MKFLKTFLGLFLVLFIPLMLVVAFFMHPAKVAPFEAVKAAAVPLGGILLFLSLGFAVLSHFMDANKPSQ